MAAGFAENHPRDIKNFHEFGTEFQGLRAAQIAGGHVKGELGTE
jgi:hypothetical protein